MTRLDVKSTQTPQIKAILKAIGNRRRSAVVYAEDMSNAEYSTFWDGGSITNYTILSVNGTLVGHVRTMPTNHPFFEKSAPKTLPELSADQIVVRHGTFCGKESLCYISAKDLSILGLQ